MATFNRRPDWSRLVPGIYKRRNRFEGSAPDGAGGRVYLGLFLTRSDAERAVIAARQAAGYRATRYAACE